MFHLIMI